MNKSSLVLPFDRGGAARFLPWLVALMVFLAALSLAAVMTLQHALAGWDESLAGTMTVELPPPPAISPPASPANAKIKNKVPAAAPGDGDLSSALAVLRATPGISNAEPLSRDEVARLMEVRCEHTVQTASRAILLPIAARWTVFPTMAAPRLLIHKIDAFEAMKGGKE